MNHCQSCGMPINAGTYCQHCVTETGELQAFEERLERMMQWMQKENAALSRNEAEIQCKNHLRNMPAWKNHPALK